MSLQRALKVRLCPPPTQANFLNKILGCRSFLYNHILAERIQTYDECDINAAINLREYGANKLLTQHEEAMSVDMKALAFVVSKSETTMATPEKGRSRNLVEQAIVSSPSHKPNPLGLGS
jgi:hypothetical protein